MIEIRSSYLVKAKDIRAVTALWKEGRERVWPVLGFHGRIQQMIHGHAQQSYFVWSSEWENMNEWELNVGKPLDNTEYREWSTEINKYRVYGEEREIFKIFEPKLKLDNTPGKVEIRSSYIVQIQNLAKAIELLKFCQEKIWPIFGWQGQNQQMLHGKASQSMLVWTSIWNCIDEWEKSMAKTYDSKEFQNYYKEWLEIVDFGGPREIFRNI